MRKIPLYILAGFLGAGKTTSLRSALQACLQNGQKPFVILNDLQNAEIDATLLRTDTPDVSALSGSCICCDDPYALLDKIQEIDFDVFDCVFLEANGSTDLWALLEFISHACKDIFRPIQVIGIVDGVNFGNRGWAQILETEQLRTATKIYITKEDLLNSAQRLNLWENLRSEFPHAIYARPEQWHQAHIAKIRKYNYAQPNASRQIFSSQSSVHKKIAHQQSHQCSSFSWAVPSHWNKNDFEKWLLQIPPEVLRIKGLLLIDSKWQLMQWLKNGTASWEELLYIRPEDQLNPALIGVGANWNPQECAPK